MVIISCVISAEIYVTPTEFRAPGAAPVGLGPSHCSYAVGSNAVSFQNTFTASCSSLQSVVSFC